MKPKLPKGLSSTAMVLAAGLGTRMRPITDRIPKPLVSVGGVTMLDFVIDRIVEAGVERVAVNVHHLPDLIETHLSARSAPKFVISDERDRLLDSGGGAKKMLALIDQPAFLLANADTLWIESGAAVVPGLASAWDAGEMDVLLLVAETSKSLGFDGRGDFSMTPEMRLERRGTQASVPWAYAGVAIFAARLFTDMPDGAFSLNRLFDVAASSGRLYGHRLDGLWMHVGTPDAIGEAEAAIARARA
jgi:N-acetyl-alpha-D-muramate 1-phosphate uridylyltransferase